MIHLLLIGACIAALLADETQIDLGVVLSPRDTALLAVGGPLALWLIAHLFVIVQARRMDRHGDVRSSRRIERVLSLARLGSWFVVVRDFAAMLSERENLAGLLAYGGDSGHLTPLTPRT